MCLESLCTGNGCARAVLGAGKGKSKGKGQQPHVQQRANVGHPQATSSVQALGDGFDFEFELVDGDDTDLGPGAQRLGGVRVPEFAVDEDLAAGARSVQAMPSSPMMPWEPVTILLRRARQAMDMRKAVMSPKGC